MSPATFPDVRMTMGESAHAAPATVSSAPAQMFHRLRYVDTRALTCCLARFLRHSGTRASRS
ncbi:hypothetical protein QOM18_26025 [Serratia marcescens]|uniref:hypothetical protein n=1 Tax=Serratia marcescens TaxID=615 RepID=UPI0024C47864|nr:hypothetical protein [Serratia marcescens]MDK1711769.1 hypothetical protein [Serratia marcescens]